MLTPQFALQPGPNDASLSLATLSPAMNLQAMLSPADVIVCPPSPAFSTTSSYSSSASSHASDSSSATDSDTTDALKRGWVAPFLLHLHQMLRRESPKIIRWTDDGVAFQILDKQAMTEQILPRYFKNKNFASFQRQLNYFGFRKWSKARAHSSTYSREHFTRDNYSAMSLVKRQSKKSRKRPVSGSASDEPEAKRAAPQPQWAASETCKPILPRPNSAAMDFTMEAVEVPASPEVSSLPMPVESYSPVATPWHTSFVLAPSAPSSLFSLPVISPTRKVASGCKLPSIHDLSFASALSSTASGRPQWLA